MAVKMYKIPVRKEEKTDKDVPCCALSYPPELRIDSKQFPLIVDMKFKQDVKLVVKGKLKTMTENMGKIINVTIELSEIGLVEKNKEV